MELRSNACRHTKPGGYFELQELDCRFSSDDGTLTDDSNLVYWSKIITQAAVNYNRPIPHYTDYVAWFEKAGFVDIHQTVFKSPTNPWPKSKLLKEVGKFQLLAHIEGLEGISLGLLTRGLNWKPEEVKVLMAKMRPELKSRAIHSYQTKYCNSFAPACRSLLKDELESSSRAANPNTLHPPATVAG